MNVNRSNYIEDTIYDSYYPYIRNIKFRTTYFVIIKCSKLHTHNVYYIYIIIKVLINR